uniref:NADH dehydrogenase [ubiquinone] 1 beta subcomplex subunit 5, mitochondrial n=1 Tax=Pelusios castaneus TaxID=367368 RepID=A0A8C8RD34_9SAUR
MAAMSLLLRAAAALRTRKVLAGLGGLAGGGRGSLLGRKVAASCLVAPVRHSSNEKRLFYIRASQFYDKRFLALLRFYVAVTGIPLILFVMYVNIFIGEAELAEIPEGYVPEHWEYYKHPITRWIARYLLDSPEKDYEKMLAIIDKEANKADLRMKEMETRRLMRQRGDGPWYFYDTPDVTFINNALKSTPDK